MPIPSERLHDSSRHDGPLLSWSTKMKDLLEPIALPASNKAHAAPVDLVTKGGKISHSMP